MYLEHFRLREMPFAITPGVAFAFASRAHQEALNTLLVSVQSGEGFVKITGEVGTGKTILCRRFLDILQRRGIVTAYIPNPAMAPRSLLQAFAEELGMFETSGLDEHTLLGNINKTLVQVAARGCSVVLCLDEAQAMPRDTLEAVRLLSNLETSRSKLLQLVMFGQPELDRQLGEHSLRQLQQRITFEYEMSGMNLRELDRYVAHRLAVAGHVGSDLFSAAAIDRLHQASRGVPRLVNILCHKSLMIVFGEGGTLVSPRHVRAAAADTTAARQPGYMPLWLKQPGVWTSSLGWGR
ncbi:AAA family ATPase [Uliginosibacterium sp. H3]|uniref:AAA family ATPase n=1 Tax=Uliginosibacterium silvisoli TaxID=3114758 RepID=A0ABU6K2E8_9RHOO|nr:AAA family ATPase [Uliginosibacterium sp. H3]